MWVFQNGLDGNPKSGKIQLTSSVRLVAGNPIPKGCMYMVYHYRFFMVNVGKYTIHGFYGIIYEGFCKHHHPRYSGGEPSTVCGE